MSDNKMDFTTGGIFQKLIGFMLPILGALILQTMYGAVDILVVGWFGTEESISAVSTGSSFINMVVFILNGRILSGVPVYDMDDLKQQLSDQQISIAILTVPSTAAQKTTDEMVDAGVKGIMNFTPIRLSAPANVRVQNVDLATELQTLIYFLDSDKEN